MTTINEKNKKIYYITMIGIALMALLSLTKIMKAETSLSAVTVPVGILFFFVVEHMDKSSQAESGLRFKSFFYDMKKQWLIPLLLLPAVASILAVVIGDIAFKGMYTTHVFSRSNAILSYNKIPVLMLQLVIAALGEEIAWRGFFLGKSMKFFSFWLCALSSALFFSIAHVSIGNFELVFFDIFMIFINSIIYAIIFKKTGNCLVTAVPHALSNLAGIVFFMTFI